MGQLRQVDRQQELKIKKPKRFDVNKGLKQMESLHDSFITKNMLVL
jgi:hypothetical protein